MFKGLSQFGDLSKMMQQAGAMQKKFTDAQDRLSIITVSSTSGAGAVTATANANGEITGLDLDEEFLKNQPKDVIEDVILAAIKDVKTKATKRNQEEMGQIMQDMGLPSNMKLPF